jgi:hypothetical protein
MGQTSMGKTPEDERPDLMMLSQDDAAKKARY